MKRLTFVLLIFLSGFSYGRGLRDEWLEYRAAFSKVKLKAILPELSRAAGEMAMALAPKAASCVMILQPSFMTYYGDPGDLFVSTNDESRAVIRNDKLANVTANFSAETRDIWDKFLTGIDLSRSYSEDWQLIQVSFDNAIQLIEYLDRAQNEMANLATDTNFQNLSDDGLRLFLKRRLMSEFATRIQESDAEYGEQIDYIAYGLLRHPPVAIEGFKQIISLYQAAKSLAGIPAHREYPYFVARLYRHYRISE